MLQYMPNTVLKNFIMAMKTENRHKVSGEHLVDGLVFPEAIQQKILEKVKDFNMDGDIFVASYPKTGTTWVQEIVWQITHPSDLSEAKEIPIHLRIPYIEMTTTQSVPYMDLLIGKPHPRFIKTHLPAKYFENQLQGDVKVIIPIRNPKDTLVSFYHFYRMNAYLGFFQGSWDEFFELFKAKHLVYGDYFDWLRGWLEYQDKSNIHFVKYEDLKEDLPKEITSIAQFLGQSLSDDIISGISQHCGFGNMKDNKMTNYTAHPEQVMNQNISPFMRKGTVGDWKNYFTPEQNELVDAQCRHYSVTLVFSLILSKICDFQ